MKNQSITVSDLIPSFQQLAWGAGIVIAVTLFIVKPIWEEKSERALTNQKLDALVVALEKTNTNVDKFSDTIGEHDTALAILNNQMNACYPACISASRSSTQSVAQSPTNQVETRSQVKQESTKEITKETKEKETIKEVEKEEPKRGIVGEIVNNLL